MQWSLGRWFESGRSEFLVFYACLETVVEGLKALKKFDASQWEGSACNRVGSSLFTFGGGLEGPVFFLLRSWGVKKGYFSLFLCSHVVPQGVLIAPQFCPTGCMSVKCFFLLGRMRGKGRQPKKKKVLLDTWKAKINCISHEIAMYKRLTRTLEYMNNRNGEISNFKSQPKWKSQFNLLKSFSKG